MARLFSPRQPPSEDLFYETYYSLSQQYPLLLLLLLIVLLGLLALLPVAWASGRVSSGVEGGSGAGVPEDFGTGTASRAFSGLGFVGLLFDVFSLLDLARSCSDPAQVTAFQATVSGPMQGDSWALKASFFFILFFFPVEFCSNFSVGLTNLNQRL